jgi:primary-amine oxidase
MRSRILVLGFAALTMLVATSVVGATSVSAVRGHSVAATTAAAAAANPLDPLTADEIQRTVTTIKNAKNLAPATFFPVVKLSEPAKSFMQSWSPGQPFPRKSFANVFDRNANTLHEAVVDLTTNTLDSWTQKPGAQPVVSFDEYADADALTRAYAPWKKAMKDRGIDPKDVYLDGWAGPDTSNAAPPGTRILKELSFYRGALPNPYDRPIEGVVVTLDMNKLKVVDFVDSGIRPVDTTTSGSSATQRTDLKPLVVEQPNGPSFTLDGRAVSWQGWHFRVDWSPREGLVLDRIGYEQNGITRSIINRLSLSEIYVPYAIPDANWSWRTAFDVGEYDLGQYTVPREANVDVPENAVFFDEVAGDTGSTGGSYDVPHGIAMYERDGGFALGSPRSDVRHAGRPVRTGARRHVGGRHRELHLWRRVRLQDERRDRRERQCDGNDAEPGHQHAVAGQPERDGRYAEDRGTWAPALHRLPDRLRRRRDVEPRGRAERGLDGSGR